MTPSDQALLTPCARILDKIHVTNMEPATKRTNDGGLELPEELLLVICEHLQPPRYEDEAALCDDYAAMREVAHRSRAAISHEIDDLVGRL